MKTIALILIILTSSITLLAQTTVEFLYDDAGNRTHRNIIELLPETNPNDSTLKSGVGEDNLQPTMPSAGVITETIGRTTVKIYPNPTGGKFTVIMETSDNETIGGLQLLSLAGEEIINIKNPPQRVEADLTGRPPGTYFLSITINGKTQTWKVIKQ